MNEIIRLLQTTNDLTQKLVKSYLNFSEVIDDEYAAVYEHSIAKYEETSLRKVELGDLIVRNTELLFATYSELASYSDYGDQKFATITEVKVLLQALVATFSKDERISRYLARNETSLQRMQNSFFELKPKIEKNKFTLQRLISNHQESYKFWQWAMNEKDASYDKNGPKVNRNAISQFQVKA